MKSVKFFDDKWLKKPSKKELYDLVEEQRKEIEKLKEENYMLRDYINVVNACEWFKYSNLDDLIKVEEKKC